MYLESDIQVLAENIQKNGLQSPIKVREKGDGYQVIHGEKRFQAYQRMGAKHVITRVIDVDEKEGIILALRENIKEGTSNPLEEALVFQLLRDRFNLTDKAIAEKIGLDRSVVANRRRQTHSGAFLHACLVSGCLTESHVRQLLRIPGQYLLYPIGDLAVDWSLTVRELKEIVDSIIEGEPAFSWEREVAMDKIYMPEGSPPLTDDPSVLSDQICISVTGELLAGQANYIISKSKRVETVPVKILYFIDWLKLGPGNVSTGGSVAGVQPVRTGTQKRQSGRLVEALIKFTGSKEKAHQSYPVRIQGA